MEIFTNIIGVLALLSPIIICALRIPLRNRGIGAGRIFYFAVFVMWIGCVVPVYLHNTHLEWRMHSFDVDGDGLINPDEMNSDARQALDDFANDSPGSSGYPLFAIFGALIWCSSVFVADHFIRLCWRLLQKRKAKNLA
ncbi:hypothetical protein JO972_16715 [Verrucomicrobiaceae bacterium 5K15]|uniref:EF-hand domain-containing protein n=1 Tax=Oceaniferula flava TaxID=2800421 RepID=A0AAE2SF70_9BACT|nr:hypothetical protein [Oceaniferula flavus]MBK1856609.1 hypothetical protein [Oceaniferula flavus]MBM1137917.1 hypothetical protein [Oceaniferula flavus]